MPPRTPQTAERRHNRPVPLAAVALGGLLGSAARIGVAAVFASEGFPVAVLVVNLLGSFLLGLYVALRQRAVVRRGSPRFWAIGVLGSFTTFATFSVDLIRLGTENGVISIAAYVVTSVLGGLSVALLGMRIGGLRP